MPKAKTGGRKPGTPNKKSQELADRCEALGVDPFEVLLHFAKGDWKALGYESKDLICGVGKNGQPVFADVVTPELRAKCAKEACEYIHPKRKALELSNDSENGFRVVIEDYTTKNKK